MKRNGFNAALHDLRNGTLRFDQFAIEYRENFERWAHYFYDRWPQHHLLVEDLIQEALFETWRAADIWDETRGSSLGAFVRFRVGRKLRVEIERVLGWPKKGAGWTGWGHVNWIDVDESAHRIPGDSDPERRSMVREAASKMPLDVPMMEDVVRGIGVGMSTHTVARRIWDDPMRRIMYDLTSPEQTLKVVRSMVNTAPKILSHR